jgi:hypothetical protein
MQTSTSSYRLDKEVQMQVTTCTKRNWANLESWELLLYLRHCIQTLVEVTKYSCLKEKNCNIIAGKIGSPSVSHNESGHCTEAYLELFEAQAPPFFAFLVSAEQFRHSQTVQLHRETNS